MAISLKYWNGRGLMEVPRKLLAIAGKFPGDYEDGRYSSPPENLTANLGRMPLLSVGDQSVGQSAAINFYLATELGLMGSSTIEAAQILSISEHLKEMMTAFRTLVPYGQEPTEEALEKWFSSGATDRTGPADGAARSTRYLMWWMGRIEETLGSSGFAVGTKLSLADVLIYETFSEVLKDEEAGSLPQYRRESFCSKAKTDALLAKYPKLQASSAAVAANANLQKWLSIRGPQMF
mmetsp:Transcript_30404/g.41639  ORF Transcript_30404/g.41639 Transcript_30404/m.41639 type:complete len:236 (+) Transcript_30404:54-761(+)